MMDEYSKHYIKTDDQDRIVSGWSSAVFPDRDTTGAICINDQGGYQFRLSTDGEENPYLLDGEYMVPLYKWDGKNVVKRTQDEIDADIAALGNPDPSKSTEERLTDLEETTTQQGEILNILLSGETEAYA